MESDTKQIISVNGVFMSYYRYLMEQKLGRKLLRSEIVHHINLNHFDNRIENLKIMTAKEHTTLHGKLRNKNVKNFTVHIEEQLQIDFKKACDDTAVNRSAWLALKMKELIEEVKKSNG